MLELFEQYVLIHCKTVGANPIDLILSITGDKYVLISCDFFSYGGDYDDVMAALKNAVENGILLPNKGG